MVKMVNSANNNSYMFGSSHIMCFCHRLKLRSDLNFGKNTLVLMQNVLMKIVFLS